jgi:glutaredoxin
MKSLIYIFLCAVVFAIAVYVKIYTYENIYIYIGLFVVFAIVALCGIYSYNMYSSPRENTEYTIPSETINFKLYYADWCPHSRAAVEIWNTVTKDHGITSNGKSIRYEKIDCSDPEADESKNAEVNGNLINSFPSIFVNLNDGSQQIEFKAKCTTINLTKFFTEFTK